MLINKVRGREHVKMDAADNRITERQLAAIDAEIEKTDLPGLQFRQLLKVEEGFDPGAASTVYQTWTAHGAEAAIISDKSQAIPVVNVAMTETPQLVLPVAEAYLLGEFERMGADKASINMAVELGQIALDLIERRLEKIALLGSDELGIKGLFNHASSHYATCATGVGGYTWLLKTPEEIVDDLTAVMSYIDTDTESVESADTIGLPPACFRKIQTTKMTQSDSTILKWFLAQQETGFSIFKHQYLTSAAQGTNKRMIAYRRDPRVAKMKNPCGLITMPPQVQDLATKVIMFKTTSGVEMRKPRAVNYLDGI